MSKNLNKIYKAVKLYSMIEAGDKIAVGISGGKDSLFLLDLLLDYKKTCGFEFEIVGITIDMGFQNSDFSKLSGFMKERNVEYKIIPSNISEVVFDIRKEKNPCSLCANLRRGALNNTAEELGCNKVALGHHKDDAIETLMLSMCYEGRINCFSPKSYMNKNRLYLIRPMVYIDERSIINVSKKYNFPIIENPCPADKKTKREDIKKLIQELNDKIPNFRKNLFGCLTNTEQLFVWDQEEIKNTNL